MSRGLGDVYKRQVLKKISPTIDLIYYDGKSRGYFFHTLLTFLMYEKNTYKPLIRMS